MRHYQHHIGDYDAATAHLTWLEDMAYTRLLRVYYRDEKAIPGDVEHACRLVRAKSKQEREAVESVLREFFTLDSDEWVSKRAEIELEKYRAKQKGAEKAANARWSQCERNATASQTHGKRIESAMPTNNHEPITNNHEPENTKDTASECAALYELYPRKIGKPKAIQAIKAALKKTDFETLRSAVEAFAKSPAGNAGNFTPYPATWFNQDRWNDDRKEWNRRDDAGRPRDVSGGDAVNFDGKERGGQVLDF